MSAGDSGASGGPRQGAAERQCSIRLSIRRSQFSEPILQQPSPFVGATLRRDHIAGGVMEAAQDELHAGGVLRRSEIQLD
jgi:hypothetical protein